MSKLVVGTAEDIDFRTVSRMLKFVVRSRGSALKYLGYNRITLVLSFHVHFGNIFTNHPFVTAIVCIPHASLQPTTQKILTDKKQFKDCFSSLSQFEEQIWTPFD